ncbi:MAG: PDZ domain-containing protein, partial [Parvibaculaceae bacterium]|nr:PDZ domain-containing protein [Parvibaculaceae bacterium]
VQYRMATRGLGGTIALEFTRDGTVRKTKVALQSAPEDPPRNIQELRGQHPFDGSTVGNLSPAFAEELRIDAFSPGVVVVRILRGSSAHRVGLRPRDVILEISGEKVGSVSQLEAMVGEKRRVWEMKIKRGNEIINASVRG